MRKLMFVPILLCIAALAFAGGKKDDSFVIKAFHETGNHPQPSANNPMYQYLKEKLGVTFQFDILVGDAAQKKGVMIASGDLPDVVELRGTEFIDAGVLIPLEGLIEKNFPNIKKHFGDTWDKMRSPDGHIYHLVNYGVFQGRDQSPNYDQTAFWVQKAVLKDAGYPKIATIDQYFDMIAAYYKKYPTINGQPTLPFVFLTDSWRVFELWNPPNFLAGYPNEGNGIVNPTTREYKNFFTQDISKRWFQKLNQLNAQGLLDRSSLTDNYDQYSAKIASGRVLGQSMQGWQFMYQADMANRDRGEYIRTMAPLPIVWDNNTKPRYRNITIPNLYRGLGITTSAKDPMRILRFVDQFLSEEIQRTISWGFEGKDWQRNASGVPYRTQQQRDNWQNVQWQEQNRALLLEDLLPKIQGSFSDGYPADLSVYYPEREATLFPEDKELFQAYGVTSTNELMDKNPPPNSLWFPTWSMEPPPDGSPAQIALQRCEETMRQRLPQMILAAPADFERLWAAYVQEMTVTNNIAVYEQYMQQKLNERIRAWSR